MTSPGRELLRFAGLSKTFPGTRALSDVNLAVRAGEVHGLVGHNGSGKSTLIKILSGFYQPNEGSSFWLHEQPVKLSRLSQHDRDGRKAMAFVHQDSNLILEMSAIENLILRSSTLRSQGRSGRGGRSSQEQACRDLLARFSVELDPNDLLVNADPVQRTVVALACALQDWDSDGGILVLDEPTAALPGGEVNRLFRIIRTLRDEGAGILYVSHRLDEIFALADRVSILRGGELVTTDDVANLTKRELVRLMLGEEMEPEYRASFDAQGSTAPAPAAQDLAGATLEDANFTLQRGEILGIAGLPGSGADELPRLLTDRRHAASGMARVKSGRWVPLRTWKSDAIALLPPDRSEEGMIGPMTVAENLSLSVLGRLGKPWRLNHGAERSFTKQWIGELNVVGGYASTYVERLSGGNQQKVLFGRALARDPLVLVLCDPTAGVDISSRFAIYELIARHVREGLSVIVTSSDMGDLVALCSRVLIFQDGKSIGELPRAALSESQLVHAIEGLMTVDDPGTKRAGQSD